MADVRLIDANALMKNIGKIPQLRGITYGRMKKAVEETPTIDTAPVVHGRWIRANDEQAYFDVEYVCSECQFVVAVSGIGTPILYGYKYCPGCGAKMDGGAD